MIVNVMVCLCVDVFVLGSCVSVLLVCAFVGLCVRESVCLCVDVSLVCEFVCLFGLVLT